MTNLQHLSLSRIEKYDISLQGSAVLLGDSLSSLKQLTHLSLGCGNHPETNAADVRQPIRLGALSEVPSAYILQYLSSLTALQELKLCMPITPEASGGLTALSRLTWLLLDSTQRYPNQPWSPDVFIPANKLPAGISRLTNLQRLQLRQTGKLDPTVLDSMPDLRHLELTCVATAQSAEAPLAAVGRTQQLTYLWWGFGGCRSFGFRQLLLELTAKSTLQQLHVSDMVSACRPGRKLPSQLHAFSWLGTPAVAIHELPMIADTCPDLQELTVSYECRQCLSDGSVAEALCKLPDLTRLVLSAAPYEGFKKYSQGIMGLVVNLTQLCELEFRMWGEQAESELMGLAQLVNLTRLVYQTDQRHRRVLLNKVCSTVRLSSKA